MSPETRRQDCGESIDLVLGQLTGARAEHARARAEREPEFGALVAADAALFAQLRTLTCAPSQAAGVALRVALERRQQVRADALPVRESLRVLLHRALRIAAVAAIVLQGAELGGRLWREQKLAHFAAQLQVSEMPVPTPPATEPALAAGRDGIAAPEYGNAESVLAAGDKGFADLYARVRAVADLQIAHDALEHDRNLALRRIEFANARSAQARRLLIERSGGSLALEERVQALVAELAQQFRPRLADGSASVPESAYALRAFLAAGSTCTHGEHASLVRATGHWLEHRLLGAKDGDLAIALAALTDLAVLGESAAEDLVREHGQRLVHSLLQPAPARASELLRWETDLAALGDAGLMLRFLPAFGVQVKAVYEARLLLLTHLEARLANSVGERPQVLAAELYGFGDLVARAEVDRRLRLWRPKLLLPDYVAVHHLSWSQYPLRLGWSEYQNDLRQLAAIPTPDQPLGTAALALSLALHYAAPGAYELAALGSNE